MPGKIALCALLALAACAGCHDDSWYGEGFRGRTGLDTFDARYGHTQTTLADGRVVLLGGVERRYYGADAELSHWIETLDPSATPTAWVMGPADGIFERAFHAAALSDAGTPGDPSDDYVLAAGGLDRHPDDLSDVTHSVIRYEPSTAGFGRVGQIQAKAFDLQAVAIPVSSAALPAGTVVFLGGRDERGVAQSQVEAWLPPATDGSYRLPLSPLNGERWNHRAVFAPNGRGGWIVVAGGRREDRVLDSIEVYDVDADLWSKFDDALPGEGLQYHTMTLLDNDTPTDVTDDAIVITGGLDDREEDLDDPYYAGHGDRDEVYVFRVADQGVGVRPLLLDASGSPVSGTLFASTTLSRRVFFHSAAAANGRTLVVTGGFDSIFLDEYGYYHPGDFIASDPVRQYTVLEWTGGSIAVLRDGRMLVDRAMHASSPIRRGGSDAVLVTGGINDDFNSNLGAEIIYAR